MISRLAAALACALALVGCKKSAPEAAPLCAAVPTAAGLLRAGRSGTGALLPNGRAIAPYGELLQLGQAGTSSGGQNPMGLAVSPDGSLLATADFGVNLRSISLINSVSSAPLTLAQQLSAADMNGAVGYLRGIAFSSDGQTIYAANSGADRLDLFARQGDGTFAYSRSIPMAGKWPSDLLLSPDGTSATVAFALSNDVRRIDLATGAELARDDSGGTFPIALAQSDQAVYVANEGPDESGNWRVFALDPNSLAQQASWVVGKNPSALALAPDFSELFIAASDDDWIDRIDLRANEQLTPIPLVSPRPAGDEARPYSGLAVAPTSLLVSRDGNSLYVASMLLSAVLVYDAREGIFLGAIPAGMRPTALAQDISGNTLYIASSEGQGTLPDTDPNAPSGSDVPRGGVQRVTPIPQGAALQTLTAQVNALNALPEQEYEPFDPRCARIGPLPAQRDAPPGLSLIKHVIYVLKENKTFDENFGDFPNAEADPSLVLFGNEITPNQHELAREYCLLDNFYTESEQSVEGHFWATASTTTDYFQRVWPATWGGRVEDQTLPPGGIGPLDSPRHGFAWDQLARAGIPYESYGEFVGIGGDLAEHIDLDFVPTPFDFLDQPDTVKLPIVLEMIAANQLPAFTFVALQWDHTYGAQAGKPAPDYMVADNDLATGQLIDAVTKSPYWSDTLILITEDDPAGALDHIDAHRSFALVVSPYAARGKISHVRASFPSLAATWERALGAGPSSQLDADAEPLWDCLVDTPDMTGYSALPSNVAPHFNRVGAPGELESRGMDFSSADRAHGMAAVLWKVMRPKEAVPAKVLEADDDDEEEEAREADAEKARAREAARVIESPEER